MKNHRRLVVAAVFCGIAFLTGCTTMQVKMSINTPTAELAGIKIPAKVGLYLDNDFRMHEWAGMAKAELSKLNYELGMASKGFFQDAFLHVADSVTLVNAIPPYSEENRKDIALVVKPTIVSFREKHSAWLRVANYHAEIIYHVTVYDGGGKVLLEKDYSAQGNVRGVATHSPGSNYAAPAEAAMQKALVAIVQDILALKLTPPSP